MNSTLVNPIDETTHNHHWLDLRKEGVGGVINRYLPPVGGSLPSPNQHSAQPITSEIIFTEIRVPH